MRRGWFEESVGRGCCKYSGALFLMIKVGLLLTRLTLAAASSFFFSINAASRVLAARARLVSWGHFHPNVAEEWGSAPASSVLSVHCTFVPSPLSPHPPDALWQLGTLDDTR